MPAETRSHKKGAQARRRFIEITPSETPCPGKEAQKILRLKRKIMDEKDCVSSNKRQKKSSQVVTPAKKATSNAKQEKKVKKGKRKLPSNAARISAQKKSEEEASHVSEIMELQSTGLSTLKDLESFTNLQAVITLPVLSENILNTRGLPRLKSELISNPNQSSSDQHADVVVDEQEESHSTEPQDESELSQRIQADLSEEMDETDKGENSVIYEKLLADTKLLRDEFAAAQRHTEDHLKANDRFVDGMKVMLLRERNEFTQTQRRLEEQLAQVTKEKEAAESALKAHQDRERELLEEQDQLKGQIANLETAPKQKSQNISEEPDLQNTYHLLGLSNLLTGLKITKHLRDDCGIEQYECTLSSQSKRRGLHFNLSFDQDYDELHYQPKTNFASEKKLPLRNMPEYLKKDIFFQSDQAPLFFLKLLNLVHQTDKP